MDELCTLSASELASRVARREVSPVDVVAAAIDRIATVNPALNAVVDSRFEAAREEARRAEQRLQAKDDRALPPLFGVPCTIKEFIAVQGMSHTAGVPARKGTSADRDAPCVANLRRAGAIVLGVTNGPEGGLWAETNNPIYGRTHNPHDVLRTPGGSSGGEAAIIAAGGSPCGLGSDVGGSIRFPASFCGIAGHKPSDGLVSIDGHFPPSPPDHDMTSIGPLARTVDDLSLLLQAASGGAFSEPKPAHDDLSDVRVYALVGCGRTTPDVAAAVMKSAAALAEHGGRVVDPDARLDFRQAFHMWLSVLSSGSANYDDVFGEHVWTMPFVEALKWPLGRARHAGPVIGLLLSEKLVGRAPWLTRRFVEKAAAFRSGVWEALGRDGVIVTPAYPTPAPRHREMVINDPRNIAYSAVFNLTHSPVTTVPVDVSATGLPIGVQVAAAPGNDALTLRVARALEAQFGAGLPVEPRRGKPLPFGIRFA